MMLADLIRFRAALEDGDRYHLEMMPKGEQKRFDGSAFVFSALFITVLAGIVLLVSLM